MQLQNAPYMFHVSFAFLWIVQIVWYLVQCKKEKLSLMRFNVHRDYVCSSGQVTLKVKIYQERRHPMKPFCHISLHVCIETSGMICCFMGKQNRMKI